MMALWLMLSGIYKPMLIGFGIVSVVLVMVIVRRMDQVDGDHMGSPGSSCGQRAGFDVSDEQ